ncbi:uncharacterized protein LOC143072999 isoform X2 [Mytilus galloprovincialis]|uniref:uncharacterized protein LOC143072999 isoform X2 n=1 Tax=Mytilus galloprovincialis TaxID=29158 RepID=UPI003F7B5E3F
MPFGTSTGWAKWAFVIMCIAPILFIVGFATNYWMQNDSTTVTSVGLWKAQTCTSGTCDTQSVPSSYKNDNFRATQAFEIMALIMFLVTPVFLGIYVFAAGARTYNYAVFCMVMCFVTAALLFTGSVLWIFALLTNFSIAWSYGLTLVALILAIIAGILFVPEVQNFNYFYGHYEDEYDSYYEKKSRISPGNYTKNYSPRQPRYARNIESPPSTSSTSGSGRTISTSMSNSTTYDSMPQPMAVDNPNTLKVNNVSSLQNSRPTFNDVSAIKLQRDQVF